MTEATTTNPNSLSLSLKFGHGLYIYIHKVCLVYKYVKTFIKDSNIVFTQSTNCTNMLSGRYYSIVIIGILVVIFLHPPQISIVVVWIGVHWIPGRVVPGVRVRSPQVVGGVRPRGFHLCVQKMTDTSDIFFFILLTHKGSHLGNSNPVMTSSAGPVPRVV